MFPLGGVVFPHSVLPLYVFEPRYRDLTTDCLAGDGVFGIVLIERGSEVGGGDTRFGVGTCTRIMRADRSSDGRWWLVAAGEHRVRVTRWLPDDPYPRAEVEDLADHASPGVPAQVADVQSLLDRVLGMLAQLVGSPAPPPVELAPEPVRASFEAAARAPIGPLDAQHRLAQLTRLLIDELAVLEFRLGSA
jgi:uncharacterized protein